MRRISGALLFCSVSCHAPRQAGPEAPHTTVLTAPAATASAATATSTELLPAPASKPAALEPAPQPAAPAQPAPTFVVRYACDDKYAVEAECRPGQPAWSAWLAGLALGAGAVSLLDHQGGGPSGAEWNPEAPLVAFIASTKPGSARLELSDKRGLAAAARFEGYDVFFVPSAAWNRASRPAQKGDLSDPAQLDAIRVVELGALGQSGELARGTFAFSGGE